MAHARNIPVIVDGAHAFNHFPFKISDLNCDYYGVSLHKWTCAPVGTGFLYVRKSRNRQHLVADGVHRQASWRYSKVRKKLERTRQPITMPSARRSSSTRTSELNRKAARLRYLRDRWAHRLAQNPKCKILHSADPAQSCGIGFLSFQGANFALGILGQPMRPSIPQVA